MCRYYQSIIEYLITGVCAATEPSVHCPHYDVDCNSIYWRFLKQIVSVLTYLLGLNVLCVKSGLVTITFAKPVI